MKKIAVFLLIVLLVGSMSSCFLFSNLTEKDKIINLYNENKEEIKKAVESKSFVTVKFISGIEDVYESKNKTKNKSYIDFLCGGKGIGMNTEYYGFFYSAEDDMCVIWLAGPEEEMVPEGDGYIYRGENGKVYYVEKIDEHFFYYEGKFQTSDQD